MSTQSSSCHEHFYVEPDDVNADSLVLRGGEFRHAVKVLRKKKGSVFAAVDGCGNCYKCKVKSVSTGQLCAQIISTKRGVGEPKTHLTLAQCVIKGNRFDWVVEKGTEIGISAFIPVLCERSVAKAEHKEKRWQRIALAAMKQCGRSILPKVFAPQSFLETMSTLSACNLKIIADENSNTSLQSLKSNMEKLQSDTLNGNSGVAFLIGPEGGFGALEVTEAIKHGFTPVSFGPRRLRSETAGLVAATLILGSFGELGI